MEVEFTSPELLWGRDSGLAGSCKVVILKCGSIASVEMVALERRLGACQDLEAYEKVNFFFELQRSLEVKFGFAYYRGAIPGDVESGFYEEAYARMWNLDIGPLAESLPCFRELHVQEVHSWAGDLVQELVFRYLAENCAKAGKNLLVVMCDPALDVCLLSPAKLAKSLSRPVGEGETGDGYFYSFPESTLPATGSSVLLLVEDSGSWVNLTSAMAIMKRLRAAGRRTIVVTHSPTVVSALQEAGAENLSPSAGRELPRVDTPSRPGYLARVYALLRFPVVLTYQHLRLRLYRLALGVASWLRRRLSASPEEYGFTAALGGEEDPVLGRFALHLPYRIQITARRYLAYLSHVGRIVEEMKIQSCVAVGEANVAAALVYLSKKGLTSCGVLPVLICEHPSIRCCWFADRHLVYGEQAREVLEGAGIPPSSIEVVGSEHFDRYARRSAEQREEDGRRFHERFPQAVGKSVVVLTTEAYPRLREVIGRTFRQLLQIPGLFVLLKVHPDDELAAYQKLIQPSDAEDAAVVKKYPVAEILSATDLLVSAHSNMIVEAAAAGVPSLAIHYFDKTAPLDFEEEGICFGGRTLEDLMEKVEKILGDAEMRQAALAKLAKVSRFNGPNDGRSTDRIVDACLASTRSGSPTSR